MARSIRMYGDKEGASRCIPEAERLLFLLKTGNINKLPSVWDNRYLADGSFVQISSIFGNDYISITTPIVVTVVAEGDIFSAFCLIFATEWGLQGFDVVVTKNEISLTPKDIPNIETDTLLLATSGHVELDENENPVWVKGSAVSSIDRENKLYTFRTNRSAQDVIGGMAYDLYADRIYSYGSLGFEGMFKGLYADIYEDYSAGTTLVYTPFSNGVLINPNKGTPYKRCNTLPDLDALGRRPYNIDFKNSKIITNGERVVRGRATRIDEQAWVYFESLVWTYYCSDAAKAYEIQNSPPGVEYDEPDFSFIDDPAYHYMWCLGPPANLFEMTMAVKSQLSYNNKVHGKWDSIWYYNEAKIKPKNHPSDPDTYELIQKGEPLFTNTTEIEVSAGWEHLQFPWQCVDQWNDAGMYYSNTWVHTSTNSNVSTIKYDVRACLGNKKFIYDKSTRTDIKTMRGKVIQGLFQQGWSYAYPENDDVYNGTTEVYIGDYLFKTNNFLRTYKEHYPRLSGFELYVFPPEGINGFPEGLLIKEDNTLQEETFFMDYDYDLEYGKNGIFFYQNIKTEISDYNEYNQRLIGMGNDAWTKLDYSKEETYEYGIVIELNGSHQIIPLPYTYIRKRKMHRYNFSSYEGGYHETFEDTGYYYEITKGQRIWLTSSYISDKEMVFSYLIEDVSIDVNGVVTSSPNKRITEYIGLTGNTKGIRKTFETLPFDVNRYSPSFTITKITNDEGPLGTAKSLRVMVVAMTTINMTIPEESVAVELAANQRVFNVSYSAVPGASHYAIFIAPTTPPLFYDGVPIEWFKPIITAELSIDITEELLAASGNDTRNMSMQGSSYDILKHGSSRNIYNHIISSPKLVPAIGIYRAEIIV